MNFRNNQTDKCYHNQRICSAASQQDKKHLQNKKLNVLAFHLIQVAKKNRKTEKQKTER